MLNTVGNDEKSARISA